MYHPESKPSRPSGKAIIFDGDDTLWDTQPLYEQAKKQFAAYLREASEDHVGLADVIDLLNRIDAEKVKLMGFSPARFPSAMIDTYRLVRHMQNQALDPADERAIEAIGYSVFTDAPMVYEDAPQVLSCLKQFYMLCLATKGDFQVQQARIVTSGLESYFDRVYILKEKTDAEYGAILMDIGLQPGQAWVVGNSIRSDINPALRVKIPAVWIARETWLYENDILDREVFAAQSLHDAATHILALDQPEVPKCAFLEPRLD